jgi:beta-N-acetylhexosaminidase
VETVVACADIVIRAHDEAGVACCLKHFPGHGSSSADSHLELPDITGLHTDEELEVFRRLLNDRVCVMTGHLLHRGLDPERPASLSRSITTDLLRERMGFQGVVVTDSIDMDGVRARWSLQETIAHAVHAGADLVVHACNSRRGEYAPEVVQAVVEAAGSVDGALLRRAHQRLERLFGGGDG